MSFRTYVRNLKVLNLLKPGFLASLRNDTKMNCDTVSEAGIQKTGQDSASSAEWQNLKFLIPRCLRRGSSLLGFGKFIYSPRWNGGLNDRKIALPRSRRYIPEALSSSSDKRYTHSIFLFDHKAHRCRCIEPCFFLNDIPAYFLLAKLGVWGLESKTKFSELRTPN